MSVGWSLPPCGRCDHHVPVRSRRSALPLHARRPAVPARTTYTDDRRDRFIMALTGSTLRARAFLRIPQTSAEMLFPPVTYSVDCCCFSLPFLCYKAQDRSGAAYVGCLVNVTAFLGGLFSCSSLAAVLPVRGCVFARTGVHVHPAANSCHAAWT